MSMSRKTYCTFQRSKKYGKGLLRECKTLGFLAAGPPKAPRKIKIRSETDRLGPFLDSAGPLATVFLAVTLMGGLF